MKTIVPILMTSMLMGCITADQPTNARLAQSWLSGVSVPSGRDIPPSFLYTQFTSLLKEHGFQLQPEQIAWTPADLEAISITNNPTMPVSLVTAALSMRYGGSTPLVCRFNKNGISGIVVSQRDFDTDNLSIEATADNPRTANWDELDQIVKQFEKLKERAYEPLARDRDANGGGGSKDWKP